MQLPAALRQALGDVVGSVTPELVAAAQGISARYRRQAGNQSAANLAIQSDLEARAYLAFRFPATYCAMHQAIIYTQQVMPDFAPTSVLDVGAGPATASLAALSAFPTLADIKLLEPNLYLQQLGQRLLQQTTPATMAEWIAHRFNATPATIDRSHDLVLAGYMLNEIWDDQRSQVLDQALEALWAQTHDVMIMVEPGTPQGQRTLLHAREKLMSLGGYVVAPCPHDAACALAASTQDETRWCHFSVRVERSKLHKATKDQATVGYEDEKFSYLVVSKQSVVRPQHRLIGTPRGSKVIEAELCEADGATHRRTVSKSSSQHKTLRGADWGDGF